MQHTQSCIPLSLKNDNHPIMFKVVLTALTAGLFTYLPAASADTAPMEAQLKFDINELHDCYNDGEIMFFRDGSMTYAGDDFNIREPKEWLVGGEVKAGDKIGLELSNVKIEHEDMFMTVFDMNGKREIRNQDNMPKDGDQWEITVSDGMVAFGIGFDHKTAMLALSFDLYDLNNPENRTRLDYSLSCNQEPIPDRNKQKS